jgi:hypothetical protein
MLHNGSNEFPTLDPGEQHLWNGVLFENAILLALHWQANVYTATLCRHNLRVQAVFAEVDLPRIGRIELDRGRGASNLKCERR